MGIPIAFMNRITCLPARAGGFTGKEVGEIPQIHYFSHALGLTRTQVVSGDIEHIEIVALDNTVEMRIDEVLARSGTPMSQEHVARH
jgi:hypothetical protein